jgi:hypothetical protein
VATLTGITTDKSTWVTLSMEGAPLTLPSEATWLFEAHIVARSQASANDAGFIISGVVTEDGLLGTQQTTVAKSSGSLQAQVVHDVLNNALAVQVKGIKDETVDWVARVDVTPILG